MATNTTRLNLYKPGGGSSGLILPDEIADIDKINGNMDLIDAAIGVKNVTSTTRPATPYDGQIIRESDTKSVLIYSLALVAWVSVGAPLLVSTLATLSATTGVPSGTQAVVASIAGLDDDSRWIMSSTSKWIPLGPLYVTSITSLDSLTSTVAGLANVKLNDSFVGGALASAGTQLYRFDLTAQRWLPVSGMIPMMPSSTVGFSSNISSIYTFSAVNAVRMAGVFVSGFEKYRVVLSLDSMSATTIPSLRLSLSGTDDSGANYTYQQMQQSGASVTSGAAASQTSMTMTGAAGLEHFIVMDLTGPAVARATRFQIRDASTTSGTALVDSSTVGRHGLSTAYDGIYISLATGTMSGTMQVEAYAG